MRNRWFHLPVLHTAFDHEKKVSWLELFFDLIFVAAVIQLGDALSEEVSATHHVFLPFAKFAALFVPLWVAWTGFTFFANRFDIDDFLHRTTVFLTMFTVGAMAIAVPGAMRGEHETFALAFACAQGLIALMHLRTLKQAVEAKSYSRHWGLVFGGSALIWLISVCLPSPVCYGAWAVGVLIILFSPIQKQSRALTERHPLDLEHLSERYGLLTIIVLGESFVKVLSYLSTGEQGANIDYLIKGCLYLLITCSVWWIYFDDVAGSRIRQGRGSWIVWLYGHIPLAIGITALAVGVKKALTFDFGEVPPSEYRWLLAGALSLTLIAVAIIDSVTERRQADLSDRARVNVRFASAVLVLLLAPAGGAMSAATFVAIMGAACLGQVLFDMMMAPLEHKEHPNTISTTELARRRLSGDEQVRRAAVSSGLSNIVRTGTPATLRRDLYFFFMEGSWSRLLITLGFLYVLINVFFAALFLLEPGSISGSASDSFADAFQFSVQTMSTIGYGVLSPQSAYANLIVTIEAAVGLLGVALVTGLMFAKASRTRSSVLFSAPIIINTHDGRPTLMFRVGNARGNEIVDASVSVSALRDVITPEGQHIRRVLDLDLVRNRSPLFTLSWTVMHIIDDKSPIADIDWGSPSAEIAGFIVTMLGHDGTYGQTTYARHVYDASAVQPGRRFVDVLHQLDDGRMLIDYDKFHDTVPEMAEGPA